MEAILFQHLSSSFHREKGTTSPLPPSLIRMEYLQRSYLGGEWEGQALWLWTQPIKTADNSITMNGQRTAKRDKILSQSVRWCQMPLRTHCPPNSISALFFHFPAGPSDNAATLVNPIEIMYFVERRAVERQCRVSE